MKSGIVATIVAGILLVGGLAYAFLKYEPSVAGTSETIRNATGVVQVADLAAKPDRYEGEIVLHGIVSGVNEKEGVFGLADASECVECTTGSCAVPTTIPVKFSGEIPAAKTSVDLTGSIVKTEQGMLFQAEHMKTSP